MTFTAEIYKFIAIGLVLSGLVGFIGKKSYDYVYERGFDKAHAEQQKIIDDNQTDYNNKVIAWKKGYDLAEAARVTTETAFADFKTESKTNGDKIKVEYDKKIAKLSGDLKYMSTHGLYDPGKRVRAGGEQTAQTGTSSGNPGESVRGDSDNRLSRELSEFLLYEFGQAEAVRESAIAWRDHALSFERRYNLLVDKVNTNNGYTQ